MAKKPMTAKTRNALPKSDFGLPATRQYPIPDAAHGRNALARVAQNGTPAQQAQVKKAVERKFPSIVVGGKKPKGK